MEKLGPSLLRLFYVCGLTLVIQMLILLWSGETLAQGGMGYKAKPATNAKTEAPPKPEIPTITPSIYSWSEPFLVEFEDGGHEKISMDLRIKKNLRDLRRSDIIREYLAELRISRIYQVRRNSEGKTEEREVYNSRKTGNVYVPSLDFDRGLIELRYNQGAGAKGSEFIAAPESFSSLVKRIQAGLNLIHTKGHKQLKKSFEQWTGILNKNLELQKGRPGFARAAGRPNWKAPFSVKFTTPTESQLKNPKTLQIESITQTLELANGEKLEVEFYNRSWRKNLYVPKIDLDSGEAYLVYAGRDSSLKKNQKVAIDARASLYAFAKSKKLKSVTQITIEAGYERSLEKGPLKRAQAKTSPKEQEKPIVAEESSPKPPPEAPKSPVAALLQAKTPLPPPPQTENQKPPTEQAATSPTSSPSINPNASAADPQNQRDPKLHTWIIGPDNIARKPEDHYARFQVPGLEVQLGAGRTRDSMRKVWEFAKSAKPGSAALHTAQRFTPETLGFLTAIGASVALDYVVRDPMSSILPFVSPDSNPMAFAETIDSQLGPIGLVSFGSFMYFSRLSHGILNYTNAFYSPLMGVNPSKDLFRMREGKIPLDPRRPGPYAVYTGYMSMAVGFYAMHLVSETMADPSFQACIDKLFTKKPRHQLVRSKPAIELEQEKAFLEGSCAQAFDVYVWRKRIWESMPALGSMMAAAVTQGKIMGKVQKVLPKVVKVEAFLLQATMAQGAWLNAALGWQLRLAGMLYQGANLLTFLFFQEEIFAKPVTIAFDNLMKSPLIDPKAEAIVRELADRRRTAWGNEKLSSLQISPEQVKNLPCYMSKSDRNCKQDLFSTLSRFSTDMSEWRQANMVHILEDQQRWQSKVDSFLNDWKASFYAYQDILSALGESREAGLGKSRLDRKSPISLFNPLGGMTQGAAKVWTAPEFAEVDQKTLIGQVGKLWLEKIETKKLWEIQNLPARDLEALKRIVTNFSTEDRDKVLTGLGELDAILKEAAVNPTHYTDTGREIRSRHFEVFEDLKEDLGGPIIMDQKFGQNFAVLAQEFSSFADIYSAMPLDSKFMFNLPAKSNLERYLIAAVCGPPLDQNFEKFTDRLGFASEFVPPKLINDVNDPQLNYYCRKAREEEGFFTRWGKRIANLGKYFSSPKDIFNLGSFIETGTPGGLANTNIVGKLEGGKYKYDNLVALLRDHVKPEYLPKGTGPGSLHHFKKIWEEKVDPQVRNALDYFGLQQRYLVMRLIQTINNRDFWSGNPNKRILNAGWAANNVTDALFQELNMHLLILGEIFKSAYKNQFNQEVPHYGLHSSEKSLPLRDIPDKSLASAPILGVLDGRKISLELENILSLVSSWAERRKVIDGAISNRGALDPWTDSAPGYNIDVSQIDLKARGYNLHFQAVLERHFRVLEWLMRRVQVLRKGQPAENLNKDVFDFTEFVGLKPEDWDNQDLQIKSLATQSEVKEVLEKISGVVGKLLVQTRIVPCVSCELEEGENLLQAIETELKSEKNSEAEQPEPPATAEREDPKESEESKTASSSDPQSPSGKMHFMDLGQSPAFFPEGFSKPELLPKKDPTTQSSKIEAVLSRIHTKKLCTSVFSPTGPQSQAQELLNDYEVAKEIANRFDDTNRETRELAKESKELERLTVQDEELLKKAKNRELTLLMVKAFEARLAKEEEEEVPAKELVQKLKGDPSANSGKELTEKTKEAPVKEEDETPKFFLDLTEEQSAVFSLSAQKINSLAQEYSLYASIADKMDWEKNLKNRNNDETLCEDEGVKLGAIAGRDNRAVRAGHGSQNCKKKN